MTIFDVLALIGGLCLFLFGMNVMGDSLERRAGGGLKLLLGFATLMFGILQALAVTGQVSYGAAIPIIMGQNIGTNASSAIIMLESLKNGTFPIYEK